MIVVDELSPRLGAVVADRELCLVAVRGRFVVDGFRSNFVAAKHLLAVGSVDRVLVRVEVGGPDSVPHVVGAVSQAVGGVRLPAGFEFDVVSKAGDVVKVREVLTALSVLEPERPAEPVFVPAVIDAPDVESVELVEASEDVSGGGGDSAVEVGSASLVSESRFAGFPEPWPVDLSVSDVIGKLV